MSDVDAMVAWLRSVHTADEKAARDAAEVTGHEAWIAVGLEGDGVEQQVWSVAAEHPDYPDHEKFYRLQGDLLRQSGHRRLVEHIARHDPRDTLARIEGERAILDWGEWPGTGPDARDAYEHAVRALAWGYRHRAGWQDGWAPRR